MSSIGLRADLGRELDLADALARARAHASDLEVALTYARDQAASYFDLDPALDFARDLIAILGHSPCPEIALRIPDRIFAFADTLDSARHRVCRSADQMRAAAAEAAEQISEHRAADQARAREAHERLAEATAAHHAAELDLAKAQAHIGDVDSALAAAQDRARALALVLARARGSSSGQSEANDVVRD